MSCDSRILPGWARIVVGTSVCIALRVSTVGAQSVTPIPIDHPNAIIFGGRVAAIAVHPNDRNISTVAMQFGGLWQTRDGGQTWMHLDGFPSIQPMDVAYAPKDGNTIIATADHDGRRVTAAGIWVSHDNGATWTRPLGGNPTNQSDGDDRRAGYGIGVARDDGAIYVGTERGVASSTDNGFHWNFRELGGPDAPAATRGSGYSEIHLLAGTSGGRAVAVSRDIVYVTSDHGDTWKVGHSGAEFNTTEVHQIAVGPANPGVVFLQHGDGELVLFELASGAWNVVTLPTPSPDDAMSRAPLLRVGVPAGMTNGFELWLRVGSGMRRAVCANLGCVRQLATGDWKTADAGAHSDPGDIGLDADGRPVFYGNDGGVFAPVAFTMAPGGSPRWRRATTPERGLNSFQIADVAGNNIVSGFYAARSVVPVKTWLYYATQDNDLAASSDWGRTWPNTLGTEGDHLQGPGSASSDAAVTMAYHITSVGASGLSGAGFLNHRPVPATLDNAGQPLPGFGPAFYLAPRTWARLRKSPAGANEVRLSRDDGLRWGTLAATELDPLGDMVASGSDNTLTLYVPFNTPSFDPVPNRILLARISNVLALTQGVPAIASSALIPLPNNGSLAQRFTSGWDVVVGVDPHDPEFLIAPDVVNGVMLVSHTGGQSWTADAGLTAAATRNGTFILSGRLSNVGDAIPQVTKIAFDPFDRDRIVIGLFQGGILLTNDRGVTWSVVPGTESIGYVSGFFFGVNGNIVASSFGRGLWNIDFTLRAMAVRQCSGPACHIIRPDLGDLKFPIDLHDKVVIQVPKGRLTGLLMKDGRVTAITATPESAFERYVPPGVKDASVVLSRQATGAGFDDIKGLARALQPGEAITGVVLNGGTLAALIASKPPAEKAVTLAGAATSGQKPAAKPGEDSLAAIPILALRTSRADVGPPVLANDRMLWARTRWPGAAGRGARAVTVRLDGQDVLRTTTAADGSLRVQVPIPVGIANGLHRVTISSTVDGKERSVSARFRVAPLDADRKSPGGNH